MRPQASAAAILLALSACWAAPPGPTASSTWYAFEPAGDGVRRAGSSVARDKASPHLWYGVRPGEHCVRVIDSREETSHVFAGNCEVAGYQDAHFRGDALFNRPTALCQDAAGDVFVLDAGNRALRLLGRDDSVVTAGVLDGLWSDDLLRQAVNIACLDDGSVDLADKDGARLMTARCVRGCGSSGGLAGAWSAMASWSLGGRQPGGDEEAWAGIMTVARYAVTGGVLIATTALTVAMLRKDARSRTAQQGGAQEEGDGEKEGVMDLNQVFGTAQGRGEGRELASGPDALTPIDGAEEDRHDEEEEEEGGKGEEEVGEGEGEGLPGGSMAEGAAAVAPEEPGGDGSDAGLPVSTGGPEGSASDSSDEFVVVSERG
eukprot:evm.model.scf_716.6 EVM.evm.TU.scf_716.6   scf_716:35061-36185(+)